MVQHYDLVCARVDRLELGHNALYVVERFQFVSGPVDHVASVAADDGGDALLSRLFSMVGCDWFGHYDDGGFCAASGVEAEAAASPCDYEPDVRVHVVVLAERLDDGVGHVFFAV